MRTANSVTLEKGSLVLINYTAKVKDTDEIFETTIDDHAKSLSFEDQGVKYEPRLVSVGDGWVIKGLDEALSNASPGDKIDVDVPPEKGFGVRDPRKVRMIPQRKLGEKANELRPGDTIEIDDRKAIVRFIGSGRVQVDFNHRFAGRILTYNVNILKMLTDDQEKITSLIKRRLPIEIDKLKVIFKDQNLSIIIPDDQTLIDGIQIIKKAIASDIFKYLPSISNIQIIEEYVKPPKKEDVKKEDVKKEDVKKEDVKKEDVKKEDVKKEDVKKEDVKKEDVKKEDVKKEDVKKEDVKKEDSRYE